MQKTKMRKPMSPKMRKAFAERMALARAKSGKTVRKSDNSGKVLEGRREPIQFVKPLKTFGKGRGTARAVRSPRKYRLKRNPEPLPAESFKVGPRFLW